MNCQICGKPMRCVNVNPRYTTYWCWDCERYQEATPSKQPAFSDRASLEIIKAIIFMAVGYAWAVKAYHVF